VNKEEYAQMYRLEDTHWWFAARRELVLRALRRLLKGQERPAGGGRLRLLDLGCGTGATLTRLRPFGRATGLDLEPLALAFCRERGHRELVRGSATALPFADRTFDVVVALDVLEHVADHEAAAREIARVLAPGGHVLVTVPAYRSLWSRHDVALMHRRRYRAGEVGRLLEGAGLGMSWLTYTVSALLPVVWAVRTAQKLRPAAPARADTLPTRPLLNFLLRAWLGLEGRIALRTRLPFGVSIFAVGRKPEH
jgi:SAM-dependent methyltransferase